MTWEPKVGDKAIHGDKWPTVVMVERITKTQIVTSDGKRWRRTEYFGGYPLVPFGYRNPVLKPYDANVISRHNAECELRDLFLDIESMIGILRHHREELSVVIMREVSKSLAFECKRLGIEVDQ